MLPDRKPDKRGAPPDRVSRIRIAHVRGARDRDADAEPLDRQAADFALGGREDKTRRATGLIAVQDHANLRIVAARRRGRIGYRRDQGGVADRDATDGRSQNLNGRTGSAGELIGRHQVRDRFLPIVAQEGDGQDARSRLGHRDVGRPVAGTQDRNQGRLNLLGCRAIRNRRGRGDRQRRERAQVESAAGGPSLDDQLLYRRGDLGEVTICNRGVCTRCAIRRS